MLSHDTCLAFCCSKQRDVVHLQVFSLPGLELLSQQPLSDILGFPWAWAGSPAVSEDLTRTCSIALDGSVFLTGIGWEAARLSLVRDSQGWQPAQCTMLYDWDVAEAAVAAATIALPR